LAGASILFSYALWVLWALEDWIQTLQYKL
jgi:hypothetical protein